MILLPEVAGGPVLRPAGPRKLRFGESPESVGESRNVLGRFQEALWRFQRGLGRLQEVMDLRVLERF